MYTLAQLIPECVGRYIAPEGRVHVGSLISSRTYALVWEGLVHWLCFQVEQGNSVSVAPVGLVLLGSQAVAAGAPKPAASSSASAASGERPAAFRFLAEFVEQHGLRLRHPKKQHAGPASAIRVNPALLGKMLKLDVETVRNALNHLFRRIGEVLSDQDKRVVLDLGVGTIVADGGLVDFVFYETAEKQARLRVQEEKQEGKSERPSDVPPMRRARLTPEVAADIGRTLKADSQQLRQRYPLAAAQPPAAAAAAAAAAASATSSVAKSTALSVSIPGDSTLPMGDSYTSLQHGDVMVDEAVSWRARMGLAEGPMSPVHQRLEQRRQGGAPDSAALAALMPASPPAASNSRPAPTGVALIRGLVGALPPVLDAFARTRAATYDEERQYHSASAKIAAFLTPSAATLRLDAQSGRVEVARGIATETAHASAVSPVAASATATEEKATARYQQYVESGIDNSHVAPIKDEWMRNAVSLSAASIAALNEERASELVRGLLRSVKEDYSHAVKRAVLNYVLRNPHERRRLGVAQLPRTEAERRDWGSRTVPRAPPAPWRQSIQRAYEYCHENLFLFNPAIVALLDVWARYEHVRLVRIPASSELPISMGNFQQMQHLHVAKTRDFLVKNWYKEVEAVFQGYCDRTHMDENMSDKFFNCVATVMATQLRGMVEKSARQLCEFFKGYEALPGIAFTEPDPAKQSICNIRDAARQQGVRESEQPVFTLKLAAEGAASIGFESKLSDLDATVASIFNEVVVALDGIPRVENKIFSLLEENRYINLNIGPEPKRMAAVAVAAGSSRESANSAKEASSAAAAAAAAAEAVAEGSEGPLSTAGRELWAKKGEMLAAFRASTQHAALLAKLYRDYAYLLDEDQRVAAYLKQNHSLNEYDVQIKKYRSVAKRIADSTSPQVRAAMLQLECGAVNQLLSDRANQLGDQILHYIAERSMERNVTICDRFKNAASTLLKKPITSQELVNLVKFLDSFRKSELEALSREVAYANEQVDFLFAHAFPVGKDVLTHLGESCAWLKRIHRVMADAESLIKHERSKMERHVKERREAFEKMLASYEAQVHEFRELSDLKKVSEYAYKISTLKENLAKAQQEIERIHEQESLLGLPLSEFDALTRTVKALEPFEQLWSLAAAFTKNLNAWLKGPVFKLESETVEKECDTMWKSAFRLSQELAEATPEPAALAAHIRKELDGFKPHLPLMRVLCNKGMRDRHWKEVSQVVGFDLRPDSHTTLARMLDMGVEKYIDKLEEISDLATKQWAIERALQTMRDAWTGVELTAKEHRETKTFILQGAAVEEIQTLLDDQIVKTQTMKSASVAQFFAPAIASWEKWLTETMQLVEVWLKVQTQWMYLEPVFGAPDIIRQMPAEGSMFREVDKQWRDIMAAVMGDPKVMAVTTIADLARRLSEAHDSLERIQSGLNQYLETKRLYFPRFFFLSNDELLEILSETRDPLRVQPHLKKCFEGIHTLNFADNLDILAMNSREGESVPMVRVVNPANAKGAVECWLKDVEQVMFDTVAAQCAQALHAYSQTPRIEWVLQWPGQVVIAVSQIYWTRNVAAAIREGPRALQDFFRKSKDDLQNIVIKVRGSLSPLARATLGALVVIDVHARDVVQQLIESKVTDTASFEWISQLRYLWEDDRVKVSVITSTVNYGNEYLGNSSRLVITPLTDRCYRTLMGALQLQMGGAPEGPAGTGKTETVKDLAKAVGIQCVVFNCSDGLDYLAMAKFFKGLASSGAWACFDEFNRIDLEVLSVVAQQIHTIVRAKEQRVDHFLFEGTHITLRPTCAVFITMNPGYAGRSELPDNLKALFRTVAMMVPDYALIAEILLYSYGFVNARALARKIVATYRLCSEQLSSQDHYDYGMRAVRAVLTAAKNLKQQFPNDDEDVLMLRSITDVNLPKFLAHDIPLFQGIISDLFPGVKPPTPDYGHLLAAIRGQMTKANLQPEPALVQKILQLYETIQVRHGLMLVGLPFAGKTTAMRVLEAALSEVAEKGLMGEHRVQTVAINPKSITLGQLYGQFDAVSHEWSDGVLACKFRDFSADPSKDRKWLIFDGPVDAVWIENMNTVLDDNKKLCLMSGEIIQMTDSMNLIFEVRDLAVASPATVSRCGMVYMQPESLGWRPLMQSWLATLPPTLEEQHRKIIETMVDWLAPPLLKVVRSCAAYAANSESGLVRSMLTIFESSLGPLAEPKRIEELGLQRTLAAIEGLLLFAVVWSLGAAVDSEGRKKFDRALRELTRDSSTYKLSQAAQLPVDGTVYDAVFVAATMRWVSWKERLDERRFVVPADAKFQEIIVPTVDTERYGHLLGVFLANRKPCLLVGPTGTGKSVYVLNKLRSELNRETHTSLVLNFSAQTSAQQTQALVDEKLDRRRRGVYGPVRGKKCVLFVDDLNMPKLEKYGAQPPIELLRQLVDQGGWYDLKERSFKQVVDVQLMAAMGPVGGGRNPVTDRLLRHFSVFSVVPFGEETLTLIFSTILSWHMQTHQMAPTLSALTPALVAATQDIFNEASLKLLPTPAKSHYTFNLRDFSRVVQGLLFSRPEQMGEDPRSLIRLWTHEVLRVFGDRLVDEADNQMFLGWVRDTVNRRFGVSFDEAFAHLDSNKDGRVDSLAEIRGLFFGDYMSRRTQQGRAYAEIANTEQLTQVWTSFLDDYNALSSKPMKLVMFRFAIEHASRLARILKQPGGNALLVGVGGSGKQSLTRLAAHVSGFELFQVELTKQYGVNEWRDDLRRVLRKAGGEFRDTVFLFSDTQIKHESFLEDINSILNSGEVPNLWAGEDLAAIQELMAPEAAKHKLYAEGTPAHLMALFTERVRAKLHVVLCMSPIGGGFRDRLRMFPSLVNCCTINWFHSWPEDALQSVASQFLQDVDMDERLRQSVVSMCLDFHQGAQRLAREYWQELRRFYYVTPTSYLELITTIKTLLADKRQSLTQLRERYQNGLDKIHTTEREVKSMQARLEDMRPQLARTREETEAMIKVVNAETIEANKIREMVQSEERIAADAAARAKAIQSECEADLAEAMPILEAALAALDTLTSRELSEIKAMRNPPAGVKLVMECLCVILNVPPARLPDPSGNGRMIIDYWEPAKKFILSDPKLLRNLKEYDKDNMPVAVVKKIQEYMTKPDFDINKIKKVSKAAHSLASWIYAMEAYDRVAKLVQPKKEALAKAQTEYGEVKKKLDEAQAKLSAVEAKIADLNAQLKSMTDRKAALEHEMEQCNVKLQRAEVLLGGLGGEKSRWSQQSEELALKFNNVTGDVVLASGVIAYLGGFTATFRQRAVAEWTRRCKEMGVACADEFSLQSTLGDPVAVRQWVIDGLPNDSFSIENAIIVSKSRRWPLLIDPQSQANKWIKNMEKSLVVIKLTDDYARKLESAIQFGTPCLLEDVGETLDPALEPLLLKQLVKKGASQMLRFGEQEIEFSPNFRFYITTKLRNPHYLPELATKVTLLNFMITPAGLEDQLLGIVVAKEKPELEEERSKLVVQSAENARKLMEIEDRILQVLSASKGNILDDEEAIQVLSASKALSNEITEKQKIADATRKEINETRAGYQPVAFHASVLFFSIADLSQIEPMYQYSLSWFIKLFVRAISSATFSHVLSERISNLNSTFTRSLHANVCRSLFEKDKLLFSFVMCSKIEEAHGKLLPADFRFLLTGGVSLDSESQPPNPAPQWLPARSWNEICRLAASCGRVFEHFVPDFVANVAAWETFYNAAAPHATPLPGGWEASLSRFQKLLVLRCLRPDKVIPAVRQFVEERMGKEFVEFPGFDLEGSFGDSSPTAPIIFILSAGADPVSAILRFAEGRGFGDKVTSVSLGQGQGPVAAATIQEGLQRGTWVVLQNCHLAVSWMTELERICDSISPVMAHADFRLWLTSYPTPDFPVSILQNGVKITTEPPRGLRANLLSSYARDPVNDEGFFTSCSLEPELRTMTFALSFFHAVVQERRNFGALGWNIPYGFNESDMKISVRQTHMFLHDAKQAQNIPYKALQYLIGECNYGGRVTDDWDRRTLNTLLTRFLCPDVLRPTAPLSSSGRYTVPQAATREGFVDYVRALPLDTPPEVFGLHENADITKERKETAELFASILLTQARAASAGGRSPEEAVAEVARDILSKLPPPFDVEAVQQQYPVTYAESMNTVLVQECMRYNNLTAVIRRSLETLLKALRGLVVMDAGMEALSASIFNGSIPKAWADVSYPSLKPLGAYVNDLVRRLQFLREWVEGGVPQVVWLPGIFFTQSFLTGVLQNYARKHGIPVDEICFDFEFLDAERPAGRPDEGVYVSGLFLEGARWDYAARSLSESQPKVLFTPAPVIWLRPCRAAEVRAVPHFECPVYRTSARRGVLSTTGHSTNFVMSMRLPSTLPPSHWVERGVALLTQLDD